MKLTENEKAILKGGCDNEYDDFCDAPAWTFSVIDYSGLDPKVARGAIASLVKKGLVEVDDWDVKESAMVATDDGIKVCRELGYTEF